MLIKILENIFKNYSLHVIVKFLGLKIALENGGVFRIDIGFSLIVRA